MTEPEEIETFVNAWVLEEDGVELATYIAQDDTHDPNNGSISTTALFQMSRFALVRLNDSREWVVESVRSPNVLVVHDLRCLQIIHALKQPRSATTFDGMGISPESIATLLAFLVHAQAVQPSLNGPEQAEPNAFRCWEFHDALFHFRSRGISPSPTGGTFRFLGCEEPSAAVKIVDRTHAIPLQPVDLDRLATADLSLTGAIERRRSIRRGSKILSLAELGEFLFRTSRVKKSIPASPDTGLYFDVATRPYPSGGATWSLELYVCVRRCADLAEGGYYYCPATHALVPMACSSAPFDALLTDLAQSTGGDADIVIVIASRFHRVAWKYEGLAYSLVLKEVGCLTELMYLVATAMNLAPCAIGMGNPKQFAAAFHLSEFAEVSVGEFALCGGTNDLLSC